MSCPEGAVLPIKRDEYARDILVWMALNFFRQWLSSKLVNAHGRQAKDGGYALYKKLGSAGDAYMGRTILNTLHDKFPMTRKAMNAIENNLVQMKACFKQIVEQHGILQSHCSLNVQQHEVHYLTCINAADLTTPWAPEEPGLDGVQSDDQRSETDSSGGGK